LGQDILFQPSMKTVRFSEIVESCGKPDPHLLLIEPTKDKMLQAAIRSNRVMTLYQGSGSTKTDYGSIGFEEGSERQFLIFPKTVKPFVGRRVVGIKYDLLEALPLLTKNEATKSKPAIKEDKRKREEKPDHETKRPAGKLPKAVQKTKTDKGPAKTEAEGPDEERPAKESSEKLVQFPKPEPTEEVTAPGSEVAEIKRRIREAMDVLEQGKQVAAFNLLKRIVER
jgi:hypothetical protein